MEATIPREPVFGSGIFYCVDRYDRLQLRPGEFINTSSLDKQLVEVVLVEYSGLMTEGESAIYQKLDKWIESGIGRCGFRFSEWEKLVYERLKNKMIEENGDQYITGQQRSGLRKQASRLIDEREARMSDFFIQHPVESLHYFLKRADQVENDPNRTRKEEAEIAIESRELNFCMEQVKFISESILDGASNIHIEYLKRLKRPILDKLRLETDEKRRSIAQHLIKAIEESIGKYERQIPHDGLPGKLVGDNTWMSSKGPEANERWISQQGKRPN